MAGGFASEHRSKEISMIKVRRCFLVLTAVLLLTEPAALLRAAISEADQTAIKKQYVGKVMVFRKLYRLARRLDVAKDGAVSGGKGPGFWSVDGAIQVSDVIFDKKGVTIRGAKLWANIKNDGQLHFFPAAAALKDKKGYDLTTDVVFHTDAETATAEQIHARVGRIFLGEDESQLASAPQPIVAYIQKRPPQFDVDMAAPAAFKGTLPKPVSGVDPKLSVEAQLVGQTGQESFVVYVDEKGNAAVTGFIKLLQYGLEETTIETVKSWKFQPAMKDGKPVPVRMVMYVRYGS